jgi:hypothetical protein
MLFAGAVLAFSLFTGCKQGNGDRCEIPSDCESNNCIPCNNDPQNKYCSDSMNQVCPDFGATGGATGSNGGASGTGGATGTGGVAGGTGGSAGAADDGGSDAPATDGSTD